jgi:hypothetical protein
MNGGHGSGSLSTNRRAVVVGVLLRNPSTPVELAVRLVPLLGPSEWRILARPGAVRMPISAAARKLLLTQPR